MIAICYHIDAFDRLFALWQWPTHFGIMSHAGLSPTTYRYYNRATQGLDFEGLLEDVNAAEEGSCFLMHAVAHNPTGDLESTLLFTY